MNEKNLIQIIAELRTKGFDSDFESQQNSILRSSEGELFIPEAMKIIERYRLEGCSDQENMCTVFGLESLKNPRVRGIYIERYSPAISNPSDSLSKKLMDAR